MPQEFYNEEEAEEILRLAARQNVSGGLSRDALLKTAAEVGLSEAEVDAAERKFRSESLESAQIQGFRARQRGRFVQEALTFLGVNTLMLAIWWLSGRGYFWPGWVLLGTTIGFAETVSKTFIPSSPAYQRALARWKRKQTSTVDGEEAWDDEDDRAGGNNFTIKSTVRRHR